MLHELYQLYKASPVFFMKKVLQQQNLIACSFSFDTCAGPNDDWDRRWTAFAAAYDL
jgi:hypothetical protein